MCLEACRETLAVPARGCHQFEVRVGNRTQHAAPQIERAIAELARVVEAAERHESFFDRGQLVDVEMLALRVIAPERVREPQRALAVVAIECVRIEPWIAETIIDRCNARGARIGEPGDLHRGRFAREQQRTAVRHMHVQVDQNVDAVGADELGQSGVVEGARVAPCVGAALEAPRPGVAPLDARITDHLDFAPIVVREQG